MTPRAWRGRPALAAAVLAISLIQAARPAQAQTATRADDGLSAGGQTKGPFVITPIPRRVVFTPDVKVTTVDGRTSTLVGGSAGIEMDNQFFLGAAFYGLVAPLDSASMFYGGLLTGYRIAGTESVSLAVRGLVGFGQASVYASHDEGRYPAPRGSYASAYYPYPYDPYPYYWNGFFVAEPEVAASMSFSKVVRLDVGASYRATAGFYGPESQINGFTGTFGIQFRF